MTIAGTEALEGSRVHEVSRKFAIAAPKANSPPLKSSPFKFSRDMGESTIQPRPSGIAPSLVRGETRAFSGRGANGQVLNCTGNEKAGGRFVGRAVGNLDDIAVLGGGNSLRHICVNRGARQGVRRRRGNIARAGHETRSRNGFDLSLARIQCANQARGKPPHSRH